MSFKSRYITEAATAGSITTEIQKATDFVNSANANATNRSSPIQVNPVAASTVIAPGQSMIKATGAINDLNRSSAGDPKPNPTSNDESKADRVLSNESIRANRESSQTPFSIRESTLLENIDIEARIPGPFDNNLTKTLKKAGINTNTEKADLSAKLNASKSGERNINQGTKTSFTLGARDAGRQAKDSLKTAQNVPDNSDIKKATVLNDSAFLKIGELVQEYTAMDVERSASGPVKQKVKQGGQGVQPVNHTAYSATQTKTMNDITEDKMDRASSNRKMTSPDTSADPKWGSHLDKSNIVHQADQVDAATRAQKEERLSSQAQDR